MQERTDRPPVPDLFVMDFLKALKISAAAMDGTVRRSGVPRRSARRFIRPADALIGRCDWLSSVVTGERSARAMALSRSPRPSARAVGLFEAAKAMMRRNGGSVRP
jgi:hypothetical protein